MVGVPWSRKLPSVFLSLTSSCFENSLFIPTVIFPYPLPDQLHTIFPAKMIGTQGYMPGENNLKTAQFESGFYPWFSILEW